MNLDYIKILALFLVIICCLIATYTDVKHQIIPNKLSVFLFFTGIVLVTIYFQIIHVFNYFYYLSIILVFVFSYILWHFGVWAGGDVKLLTAVSTIFIPEFLEVIPTYVCLNLVLPFNLGSFKIPTFLLIFNSVLAIVPVIMIIVLIKIINDKPYLINDLKKTLNYKEVFLSLNSLIISYDIIQQLNVYDIFLKIIFLLVVTGILIKLMKHDFFLLIFSLLVLIKEFLSYTIISYTCEFIILMILISIRNTIRMGIFRDVFTRDVDKNELREGMILAYPFYYENGRYLFKKNTTLQNIRDIFLNKAEKNLLCGMKSAGLSSRDILLIKNNYEKDVVKIKDGLSFAPFIFAGLLITICIGNTYELILLFLGMI